MKTKNVLFFICSVLSLMIITEDCLSQERDQKKNKSEKGDTTKFTKSEFKESIKEAFVEGGVANEIAKAITKFDNTILSCRDSLDKVLETKEKAESNYNRLQKDSAEWSKDKSLLEESINIAEADKSKADSKLQSEINKHQNYWNSLAEDFIKTSTIVSNSTVDLLLEKVNEPLIKSSLGKLKTQSRVLENAIYFFDTGTGDFKRIDSDLKKPIDEKSFPKQSELRSALLKKMEVFMSYAEILNEIVEENKSVTDGVTRTMKFNDYPYDLRAFPYLKLKLDSNKVKNTNLNIY